MACCESVGRFSWLIAQKTAMDCTVQGPVQVVPAWFSSGSRCPLPPVPCRALFTRKLPLGRLVWDQERGNLALDGEEVLHTPKFSSPINRDPSPPFKTHKRRALKRRSAATTIVRK
jgi:hypothetical protein